MKGNKVLDKFVIVVDIRQESLKVCDVGKDLDLNVVGEMQFGVISFFSLCIGDVERKENFFGDLKCQGNELKNLNVFQGG